MAMLRGWVRDGGRLWIALDAVAPETVEAILGHDSGIEVVDRVEIDRFTVETRDRENGMERTDEIDLEVFARIVPCDVAGQHAGVRARGRRVDQRHPRACKRVHAPFAQHERVRVSAADKNQVP
jgi:hypothetical protein